MIDQRQDSGPLDYRKAGVDIEAGNALVERIKPIAARTRIPGVLAGLGGFGSLFELPEGRYRQPVLVAGTDGVGTKLKLAIETHRHEGVGIDLVAMCVNDIVVQGAEPLFFLDYFATGRLDVEVAASVISGIGRGCELAGCALVGGETAEMPGLYQGQDYDLAGFCVGAVEKTEILDGQRVAPGDCLIGLASSGPHANGFSLIRRVLSRTSQGQAMSLPSGVGLMEALMVPTRIYVRSVLELIRAVEVHALAHITGGGLTENLPRVLPMGCEALIDLSSWTFPEVFEWLLLEGEIAPSEMLRTFNCGIGMVVCVPASQQRKTLEVLTALGETAFVIGEVVAAEGSPRVRYQGRSGDSQ